MTVLYVDVEHESVLHDPERAAGHASRLEVARNRLAIEAGEPCTVVRFDEVSEDSVSELEPSAVVLSGTTVEWQEYDFGSLQGLIDVIRSAPVPILGICAGHQLIGHAHGASWGPLDLLREGERDPDPRFGAGMRKERGFLPVEINSDCILFRGLGKPPRFFQTHYWHLRDAPAGFVVCAGSAVSPIQVIERLDKPVFGVQFHPERSDDGQPDGYTLLRNFFAARIR
ncbi:MAG: type 1 glutamine amidotransferase [Chloroflexota bacterium]|nr:MAG: hypothetical protein DLM70_09710 [Chloroflexota bacterium]